MKNFDYHDITPEISENIAVWPGDTPFRRKMLVDFTNESSYRLSTIETTVHLGAHVDAPNHYHRKGVGIESRKLDYYFGPCQVITVQKKRGSRIVPEDLIGNPISIQSPRILFKTNSFPDPNSWNSDFVSLSAELVEWLAGQGVILVGIDTPSIDLFQDTLLETHRAVYRHDLAILEGIVLEGVPDGVYTLVALPLKIKNADASPVQAILIPSKGIV